MSLLQRHAGAAAATALAVTAAAWCVACALETANGSATDNSGTWAGLVLVVVILTIPTAGALVAWRRPANPVGWLALASTGLIGVGLLAHAWAVHALRTSSAPMPGGSAAAWIATWLILAGIALVPFLVAAFPTGAPPRWFRRLRATAVVAYAVLVVGQAFAPDVLDGVSSSVAAIPNPLGVEAVGGVIDAVTPAAGAVLVGFFLVSVGRLVVRCLRGPANERRQLRWLVVALAALPVGALASGLTAAAGFPSASGVVEAASQIIAIVGSAAALCVGILRDDSFELRDYARRVTLAAVLSGLVAIAFIAVVSLVATLTSSGGAVPPAVAAAVIAVALGPVRSRLVRGIDRLLYGWRSEPYRFISELGSRLESTPSDDMILPTVVESVAFGLRLPFVRLDLDAAGAVPRTVAQYGNPVPAVVELPVVHGDRRLGSLVVGQRSAEEPFRDDELSLLRTLARQAGATAYAVLASAQLQDARQRLVRGREEERQRLRCDLHDGIGPALAGLSLQLDTAIDLLPTDSAAAAGLLDGMQTSLRTTALEVRRIAHDLRPAAIDELGLVEALREQARFLVSGSSCPLELDVDLPEDAEVPAAVEVAVYRIASEALTNVVRHAQANTCWVRLSLDGLLELDITDDGVGLPADGAADGLGLRSMHDRAVELGGTCSVETRRPSGTSVRVRLPVTT